jgi:hypothetical protein
MKKIERKIAVKKINRKLHEKKIISGACVKKNMKKFSANLKQARI